MYVCHCYQKPWLPWQIFIFPTATRIWEKIFLEVAKKIVVALSRYKLKNLAYTNYKLMCYSITCPQQIDYLRSSHAMSYLDSTFCSLLLSKVRWLTSTICLEKNAHHYKTEREVLKGQNILPTARGLNRLPEFWSSWQSCDRIKLGKPLRLEIFEEKKQYIQVLFSKLSLFL